MSEKCGYGKCPGHLSKYQRCLTPDVAPEAHEGPKNTVSLPFTPGQVLEMKRERDALFEKYDIPVRARESSVLDVIKLAERLRDGFEHFQVCYVRTCSEVERLTIGIRDIVDHPGCDECCECAGSNRLFCLGLLVGEDGVVQEQ